MLDFGTRGSGSIISGRTPYSALFSSSNIHFLYSWTSLVYGGVGVGRQEACDPACSTLSLLHSGVSQWDTLQYVATGHVLYSKEAESIDSHGQIVLYKRSKASSRLYNW